MLIAQEKRKTNIAEYILYLWQVEDLIRALDFDLDKIEKTIVSKFDADEDTRLEIYHWYKNLVLMMQKEQVTQNGHLQFLTNLTDELYRFHLSLLTTAKDPGYVALYQFAKPVIDEFRLKSNEIEASDIHVALQSLYGILLLKLQGKEISQPTTQAITHISKLLGHLATRFRQYEAGDFEL